MSISGMRRKDLASSAHIDPGWYLIDGEPGDPEGRLVGGPFAPGPEGSEGHRDATEVARQFTRRTKKPCTITLVIDMPG